MSDLLLNLLEMLFELAFAKNGAQLFWEITEPCCKRFVSWMCFWADCHTRGGNNIKHCNTIMDCWLWFLCVCCVSFWAIGRDASVGQSSRWRFVMKTERFKAYPTGFQETLIYWLAPCACRDSAVIKTGLLPFSESCVLPSFIQHIFGAFSVTLCLHSDLPMTTSKVDHGPMPASLYGAFSS